MLLHHSLGEQLERPAQLQAHMAAIEQRLDVFAASDVAVQPNSPATVTALIDSLRYDPFYVTITEEFADNEARRRLASSLLRLLNERGRSDGPPRRVA